MPRRPCNFRQRDITRAVRAVVAAGIQITRVEVDDAGKIAIITEPSSRRGEEGSWPQPTREIVL
jgi:hypothetical protein